MKLLPINQNEAVLEAFWDGDKNADDSRIDVLAPYEITWGDGASGSVRPPQHFTISRAGVVPDAPELTLERQCDLDLSGYDQLVLAAAMPSSVRVSLHARLDGQWQTVFDNLPGTDRNDEFQGHFHGARLTGLRLEFRLSGPPPAVVSVQWLLVADSAGVARMLERQPVFDPAWPGLLEPNPGEAQPELGLFFDPGDLPQLRRKMRSSHLNRHYAALLAKADQLLSREPEKHVGQFAPGGDPARGLRVRDLGKPGFTVGTIDVLAFAGIMEDDARYSRMAARMALALAHCDHWVHSFIGALSGTTAHPRCFDESYYLRVLPLVLDWAGHCLTPAGKELIRDAMIMKGLARVESDFHRWEYIRSMNQGLLFTPGRVRAYVALEKTYPRYRANIAEAERDLHTMLNAYLQPDGGTCEGMGYWHSVGEVFPTLFELSRYRGKPFSESVGDRIHKTADFALAMLSTTADCTGFLPINAAGHAHMKPGLQMAAVFAEATGSDTWCSLYSRLNENAEPQADWFHLLVAPTTAPAKDKTGLERGLGKNLSSKGFPQFTPEFYHFPVTGHAGVCRILHTVTDASLLPSTAGRGGGGEGADDGQTVVRMHLFSGPTGGGHSHQDKGEFILEAAGETLAMDRGTTNYSNPAHLVMCKAAYHNLTVPEDADGEALEQAPKTTAGGHIEFANFVNGVLDVGCDNRDAWEPELFIRNKRRVWSPAPTLFLIDDDLEMRTPHTVGFRLNSEFPIVRQDDDGSWAVHGTRSHLRIAPVNWQPEKAGAQSEGIDCHGRPVNLLRLAVNPARTHRLLTLLEVMPADHDEPSWRCRWKADENILELTSGDSTGTYGPI